MVLKFKFSYKSSDKTLIKFLDFASKQFECNYKIYQELDFVYLYIEAKEKVLEEFSIKLSLYVPMSIFYYGVEVEVVESLPQEASTSLKSSDDEKNISFCPSCLKAVEDEQSLDFYNAFKSCNICTTYKNANFIFDNVAVKSDKKLFENLSKLINEDKKIKIKTLSGTFVFSKIKNIENYKELLVTNLRNIGSMIVENATSIVALASIEKPQIEFKINKIYKLKHSIKKDKINLRFANDLTLYLLSLELQKYNIDFLNIEDESSDFDYFLDIKSSDNNCTFILDIPKIVCFPEKKLILKSNSYPKKLNLVYSKFEHKDKAQFMTVLTENELFEKSIINFYISLKDDDKISFYSKNGLVDILDDLYIPTTINELFEDIKKDEKGKKLFEKYENSFEDDFKNALNSKINFSKKSFFTYWQVAKIVLNFKNDVLTNASNSLLEKGPRIDYKIFDEKEVFNRRFNYLPLIKSAISFKLAGVDEESISLGFVESFAHFIANEIDTLHNSYELDGVTLCGDIFADVRFNNLVEKSITKNFKIYYNKEFPLGGGTLVPHLVSGAYW